jgi:hypothetical protein
LKKFENANMNPKMKPTDTIRYLFIQFIHYVEQRIK